MSNIQLFFSISGVLLALLSALYKVQKDYMDSRFTSVDNQLKFLVEHSATHGERIASVEAKVK